MQTLDAEELEVLESIKAAKKAYKEQYGELQVGAAAGVQAACKRAALWRSRRLSRSPKPPPRHGRIAGGPPRARHSRCCHWRGPAPVCSLSQFVRSEVDYTQQLCDTCSKEIMADFQQW